jgi:cytochrome c556
VRVTLTAAVEEIFSRAAFAVGQRTAGDGASRTSRADGGVLILAPTLNGALDVGAYVTVIGEVVRFDPADIARTVKNYTSDLASEVVEKYRGRPAVVATAVINAAFVDLAKRPPPPMTAEEEAFSRIMKRIGPAFAALRKGIETSSAEVAIENAAVLERAFTETEAFWKSKAKPDAAQWAHDARDEAESITRAVAGRNWDLVKASAGTLGQACQTCHGAYRERLDDGTYRIKGVARTGTRSLQTEGASSRSAVTPASARYRRITSA